MYEVLMWVFLYLLLGNVWANSPYSAKFFGRGTILTNASFIGSVLLWPGMVGVGGLVLIFEWLDAPR